MKEETANKLKKALPFLRDVDFEDPRTRKSMVYIIVLSVLVLLLVVAIIFRVSKQNKDSQKPEIELLQGDPRDPNAGAAQTEPLMEIPEGRDRDILGADNMMEAFSGTRRERAAGNRDIYEQAGRGSEDPIGDIFSDNKGYRGYETPGSAYAAQNEAAQAAVSSSAASSSPSARSSSSSYSSYTSSEAVRRDALEAFGLGSSSEEQPSSSGNGYTGSGSSYQERSRREQMESQSYSDPSFSEEEKQPEPTAAPEPARVRRPNGITTLDDVAPRGSVLTSLTQEGGDNLYIDTSDDALYKVMFLEGRKIKSGDKVRIMLIDDIVVDGVLVEHNTPLTATCSLSDRLMLTIPSVTINGRIHTLNFQAIDNDGQPGLYCPVTDATMKTEQAVDVVSSVAQSELMSMLTGVGGRLVQSGARVMKSNQKGSSTVTVDQGYQFYITKTKRAF